MEFAAKPTTAPPARKVSRSPGAATSGFYRHLSYVFSGKGPQHTSERYKTVFEVDADAMALGTPNRERSSLKRWIDLSVNGDSDSRDRARRCVHRYVHPQIAPQDGDWAAWYRAQRDRIIFV
jgi:hypothetical protein